MLDESWPLLSIFFQIIAHCSLGKKLIKSKRNPKIKFALPVHKYVSSGWPQLVNRTICICNI